MFKVGAQALLCAEGHFRVLQPLTSFPLHGDSTVSTGISISYAAIHLGLLVMSRTCSRAQCTGAGKLQGVLGDVRLAAACRRPGHISPCRNYRVSELSVDQ